MRCENCGEDTGIRKNLCGKCYAKKYRKEHPEKIKAYNKMKYKRDIKKIKEYRKDNREHLLQLGEEYRKSHRQELRDWQKKYREKEYNKVISGERKRHDKKYFDGLREKILQRDGYKCTECGFTQYEHLKKYNSYLHIHHIDGKGCNVKKPNNSEDNLQTLCTKCHIKKHLNKNKRSS